MTIVWLIILSINGNHWHEVHPWQFPFVALLVCALIDGGVIGVWSGD